MTTLPTFEPPEDLAIASDFWEAVERGTLALPRCSECGRWQWYPEPHGTDCVGGELAWEEVALTATVYTFTRVHRSFLPGPRTTEPYVVGSVDIDGVDGPRVIVNFDDDPRLAIGVRVRARFEQVGNHAHPVFAPIPEGNA